MRERVTASDEGGEIVVRVTDDGPGVWAANAERLFTPFFTTARDRGGSGLGLAIARALLAAHGGGIELDAAGPGARSTARLPAGTG